MMMGKIKFFFVFAGGGCVDPPSPQQIGTKQVQRKVKDCTKSFAAFIGTAMRNKETEIDE